MMQLSLVQQIALFILPLIFAITVHEASHGYVAYWAGDPTAKLQGRLTLNPIPHIDPIGTILVPATLFYLGGFLFGWAKPVEVSWQRLRHPRRDMALVAAAGPTSNMVMALIWTLIAKLTFVIGTDNSLFMTFLFMMCLFGIKINLVLMLLNLIPIPPLDGSRVIAAIVSPPLARTLAAIEPYGFIILVALIATGLLSSVLSPPLQFCFNLLRNFIGA